MKYVVYLELEEELSESELEEIIDEAVGWEVPVASIRVECPSKRWTTNGDDY